MKLIHLSDLHLGKRVNDYSMLEDQKYILLEILGILDEEQPDGVIIAGDIYDKAVPPGEAVQVFDSFLSELAGKKLQVFLISGNHDSPERLAFGRRLMDESGVHFSGVYDGRIETHRLQDEYGTVSLFLLPFIRPSIVRHVLEREDIQDYTQAVDAALGQVQIDPDSRNVLVAHQFVTGAERCESEELSIGGLDNVNSEVFDRFDYVALGHLHGPQKVGRETVRYCGTPLKYSFSEVSHRKSVTIVELKEKGNIRIRTRELRPLRDMRELKGTYDELMDRNFYEGQKRDDYLHITLTDEEDVPYAVDKLRMVYPNLMKLDYDNRRTRADSDVERIRQVERKSPMELFEEFYAEQNGQELQEDQRRYLRGLMEKIGEVQV